MRRVALRPVNSGVSNRFVRKRAKTRQKRSACGVQHAGRDIWAPAEIPSEAFGLWRSTCGPRHPASRTNSFRNVRLLAFNMRTATSDLPHKFLQKHSACGVQHVGRDFWSPAQVPSEAFLALNMRVATSGLPQKFLQKHSACGVQHVGRDFWSKCLTLGGLYYVLRS
jgi:hypothetical protein